MRAALHAYSKSGKHVTVSKHHDAAALAEVLRGSRSTSVCDVIAPVIEVACTFTPRQRWSDGAVAAAALAAWL